MEGVSLGVAEAALKRPSPMSAMRFVGVCAQFALIFFASTPVAAEASDRAFGFYRTLLGISGAAFGLRGLAEKGVHFVLFFSLGNSLYHGLNFARPQKLGWAVAICLLAGIGAEVIQLFFPVRHAAVTDVLLNAASGTLAAVLASRWKF